MFPRENGLFRRAGVTQLVECDLAKVDVAGSNPVSRSKKPAMKKLAVVLLLAALSVWAQDYKLEPVSTPSPGLPAAMQAQGYRVSGPSGPWCEVWLAKSIPVGGKPSDDAITFGIAQGTLMGVLRFPGKGADRHPDMEAGSQKSEVRSQDPRV